MRSVPYSSIETGVAAIAGIDPTNILAHEKVILSEYINDATRYCWDYYPWAETLTTEERYFRDTWESGKRYSIGDEVFYKDKYYRKWSDLFQDYFSPDETDWYEIGEIYTDPEWHEDGVYKIGARVAYNEKTYLCIDNLAGKTASGLKYVNYRYDYITPSDTNYFMEIDPTFERYIPYEKTGYSTIGTMISAHVSDPRYSDGTPLDWMEGGEGIYIRHPEHLNSVWLKYRAEAPRYTSDNPTASVPAFLAPAIKAYSYRSWLIGDGQHEKSQLQDIHALDLLVREVDKLNNQQDRGQPYTISSEPYRRINARSNKPVERTLDEIGQVRSRSVTPIISRITSSASGYQAVKYRNTDPFIGVTGETSGIQLFVKKGMGYSTHRIYCRASGRTVVQYGSATSSFTLFTGKAHKATGIGEVKGIEQGNFKSTIEIKTEVRGIQAIKRVTGISTSFGINSTGSGRQASRYGYVWINPTVISVSAERGRDRNVPVTINAFVFTQPPVQGIQPVRQRQVGLSKIAITSQASMIGWDSSAQWDAVNIQWENAA